MDAFETNYRKRNLWWTLFVIDLVDRSRYKARRSGNNDMVVHLYTKPYITSQWNRWTFWYIFWSSRPHCRIFQTPNLLLRVSVAKKVLSQDRPCRRQQVTVWWVLGLIFIRACEVSRGERMFALQLANVLAIIYIAKFCSWRIFCRTNFTIDECIANFVRGDIMRTQNTSLGLMETWQ